MNNLLKWGLGLAALGVTVYVVGRAWRASQKNSGTKMTMTDADEKATFVDEFDNAQGPSSRAARFRAIQESGGFRRPA